MHVRRPIAFLLSLVLWLGVSLGASADDTVLSAVAVRVNPGQLDTYVARVGQLQAAMERVGGAASEVEPRCTGRKSARIGPIQALLRRRWRLPRWRATPSSS